MAKETNDPSSPIFQLKITLLNSKPPIWRRVEVPAHFTLADLHTVVQEAMGWTNSHLHSFAVNGQLYAIKFDADEGWDDDDFEDAADLTLQQAFRAEKSKIRYEYDFGDGWEHDLLLEKILPPSPGVFYPRCTAGKMACPPEDCGGIWGYYGLLEALEDPKHSEHKGMLEWAGEIDPEEFLIESVNESFKDIFQ